MTSLYRYKDVLNESGLILACEEFVTLRKTPSGQWVRRIGGHRERFVLDDHGWNKRYCYKDKRRALESYKARKRWQIKHAKSAMARAEHALSAVTKALELGDAMPKCPHDGSSNMGMPEYFKGMVWE